MEAVRKAKRRGTGAAGLLCSNLVLIKSRKTGERKIIPKDCAIYVLSDMPRGNFINTVAHELGHHWQKHEYPLLDPNRMKVEGFAEYCACLINTAYGQPEYNREEAREGKGLVYKEGLRLYRRLAAQNGLSGALNYMKQNTVSREDFVKKLKKVQADR